MLLIVIVLAAAILLLYSAVYDKKPLALVKEAITKRGT